MLTLTDLTRAACAEHAAVLGLQDPDLDAGEIAAAWDELPEGARYVFLVQAAAGARALGLEVPDLPEPPEEPWPAVRQLTQEEADADLMALRWIRSRFGSPAAAREALEAMEREGGRQIGQLLEELLGEPDEPAERDLCEERGRHLPYCIHRSVA